MILTIHAGENKESRYWAKTLKQAYLNWAVGEGLDAWDLGGKIEIRGVNLSAEHGVHRHVRNSPFHGGLRCTSFVSVQVNNGDVVWDKVVRTYILDPYQLVKDHRTGHEDEDAISVLGGKLGSFIRANMGLSRAKEGGDMPSYWANGVQETLGAMATVMTAIIVFGFAAIVYLIFRKR